MKYLLIIGDGMAARSRARTKKALEATAEAVQSHRVGPGRRRG